MEATPRPSFCFLSWLKYYYGCYSCYFLDLVGDRPSKLSFRAVKIPGACSWEFLVEVCCLVLQILTRFQTKKCNCPLPFSDQTSKIHTRFRPGCQAEMMLSLLRLECRQKNYSIPFRIRLFLFLSYSFGIETVNTFIHSRSSLKNHTQFQTKMGKVCTRFQTKRVQKPYPMGRHIPVWLI